MKNVLLFSDFLRWNLPLTMITRTDSFFSFLFFNFLNKLEKSLQRNLKRMSMKICQVDQNQMNIIEHRRVVNYVEWTYEALMT